MSTFITLVAGTVFVAPPVIVVDRDNVEIRESCVIEIGAEFIQDEDNNGVIHILADNIVVEFSGQREKRELIQVPEGTAWDTISGIGVRIDGYKNVTLRNAHVHRFKVGIFASDCDGLTLQNCDVAGGFASHLRSTPQAEDGGDWLWPHNNDNHEWMNNYGAGIYVERSSRVTIEGCFARRRQNGILIDRVTDSRIFDNDCSFLSGWGLAMWRSSRNVISRNAFDFCMRGYSHGVYNRGQDSAGILMFEQNDENVIAENSVTHGGDGLFAFGGRDALGEGWLDGERARQRDRTGREDVDELIRIPAGVLEGHRRSGNNRNLIINNDFSFAAAHGLELTFSFDNEIIGNKFEGNAICGIWGGYSQDTVIADNDFIGNGEMGYGLERGGVNIEHGRGNMIVDNRFTQNKCGIHLWWDPDEGLMNLPWAKANHPSATLPHDASNSIALTARPRDGSRMLPSAQNIIAGNMFDGDAIAIHLRDCEPTVFTGNEMRGVDKATDLVNSEVVTDAEHFGEWNRPSYTAYGRSQPIGARSSLRGRENIIMTDWFPYDWRDPFVHLIASTGGSHEYRFLGTTPMTDVNSDDEVSIALIDRDGGKVIHVAASKPGLITPYAFRVSTVDGEIEAHGTLVPAQWDVMSFASSGDPREDVERWRASAVEGVRWQTSQLRLPFGGGGPRDLSRASEELKQSNLARDHFGTIANTRLTFPPGRWRIDTVSDDGIRVWMDDELLIDDWTWHGPTRHSAELSFESTSTVTLRVEHFELDGWSVLEVDVKKIDRD